MEDKALTTFKWKDQRGHYHAPADMSTRHLFNTLLMIWNHSAPERYKFRPYKHYEFGPYYTPRYMGVAVREMLSELKCRSHATPAQLKILSTMLSRAEEINRVKSLRNEETKCIL